MITGTAIQVAPANTANPTAWVLRVPRANLNAVYVGPLGVTSATGCILEPGDSFDFEKHHENGKPIYQLRPSDVYVVGTTGDKASWFGSP
jgi:hypothetical protein